MTIDEEIQNVLMCVRRGDDVSAIERSLRGWCFANQCSDVLTAMEVVTIAIRSALDKNPGGQEVHLLMGMWNEIEVQWTTKFPDPHTDPGAQMTPETPSCDPVPAPVFRVQAKVQAADGKTLEWDDDEDWKNLDQAVRDWKATAASSPGIQFRILKVTCEDVTPK
jgi:hypothetical protein